MSHPIQDDRYPQSLRRTARFFGVDTALRPITRVRPELLARGQSFWAAAKVHMSMPGGDAQRCNRIQLQWRSISWGGVHYADRFQSVRCALI